MIELTEAEARVLGVLLEKEKSTPEYYPMTPNSLMSGCNQKSSRNPVVQYDEDTLMSAIDGLRKKGLILTVTGGGSRVTKYRHNAGIVLDLDHDEQAVLCLLLLRGPLTPGDIRSNSGRLYDFESLDEVLKTLDKMMNKEDSLILVLPKRPGQKEARYMHILNGQPNEETWVIESELKTSHTQNLEDRIIRLEQEVSDLKILVDDLLLQLGINKP